MTDDIIYYQIYLIIIKHRCETQRKITIKKKRQEKASEKI